MVLGILTLELDIDHATSLKDKRAVLNRIKDRVRNKFNVSVAEIEAQDVWNLAVLGVVVVSNDQSFCNQVLCKVVEHVEQIGNCRISDYETEFLRAS